MADEGYAYLDVRSVPEFEQGHPRGAYNVPLREPAPSGMRDNPDFLPIVLAALPLDQPLVVGCQTGERSRTAAARLLAAGFTRVVEQRAGYAGVRDPFGGLSEAGWHKLGLPSTSSPEPGRDYASLRAAHTSAR